MGNQRSCDPISAGKTGRSWIATFHVLKSVIYVREEPTTRSCVAQPITHSMVGNGRPSAVHLEPHRTSTRNPWRALNVNFGTYARMPVFRIAIRRSANQRTSFSVTTIDEDHGIPLIAFDSDCPLFPSPSVARSLPSSPCLRIHKNPRTLPYPLDRTLLSDRYPRPIYATSPIPRARTLSMRHRIQNPRNRPAIVERGTRYTQVTRLTLYASRILLNAG